LTILLICLGCIRASAQQTSSTDSEHFRSVDKRGDLAMGFSQEMTAHHFLLFKDGGAIEVEADNPDDAASKEAIRDHLVKIAGMFSEGDFQLPVLIHSTVPPGVDTMQRLKNQIVHGGNNPKGRSRPDQNSKLRSVEGNPRIPPFPDRGPSNARFCRSAVIAATPRWPGSSFQAEYHECEVAVIRTRNTGHPCVHPGGGRTLDGGSKMPSLAPKSKRLL
jgi:hypothetical protein